VSFGLSCVYRSSNTVQVVMKNLLTILKSNNLKPKLVTKKLTVDKLLEKAALLGVLEAPTSPSLCFVLSSQVYNIVIIK